jgi:hypothetical protein
MCYVINRMRTQPDNKKQVKKEEASSISSMIHETIELTR